MNKFQSIQSGILYISDTPNDEAKKLGVTYELVQKKFQHLSEEEVLQFKNEVQKISFFKISLWYLQHPKYWNKIFSILSPALSTTPIEYLGNYPKKQENEKVFRLIFQYSDIRDPIVKFIFNYYFIFLPILFFVLYGSRSKWEIFAFLFFLLHQIIFCIIGDGFYSIHRHLTVARVFLDLFIILCLYSIWEKVNYSFSENPKISI